MKGLLSLLLVLMMLCSCGRAMPQEEIPQSDTPKVSEEQPADVETDEIPEEITPIEEETEVNPETDSQPKIEQTQPPEEIIHLPNQELSPTPIKEAEKVNPNTDSILEPKEIDVFDVSRLDGLYDFGHALYSPMQMIDGRYVESSNRMFQTNHPKAIDDFIGELKSILSDIAVIQPSDAQIREYELQQSTIDIEKLVPNVRISAGDFKPVIHIYSDISIVQFCYLNEEKEDEIIYLETNESMYWDIVYLVEKYNNGGYDMEHDSLEGSVIRSFGKGNMEFYYEGKQINLSAAQNTEFTEELSELVDGKGEFIPSSEQIDEYQRGSFIATIKNTDEESRIDNIYFGSGYFALDSGASLNFYYAGNIQNELHDLFEKYAN